jgi:uncharacterized DUF497 family protein
MERFEWESALVFVDDREDYGELREIAIGCIGIRLYYSVFATQEEDTVRVISLRPANRAEARRYGRER